MNRGHPLLKPDLGAPEGFVGKQVWLKPGDVVTTSIEKLGDLEFKLTCIHEPDPSG